MTRTLLIDNYDSYTFNLYQQLSVINGCEPIVLVNDASFDPRILETIDNVVISPGPGNPTTVKDFGISHQVIDVCEKPILGVCLGHQGIVTHLGGAVRRAEPMHGQTSCIRHDGSRLFSGVPSPFRVVRYHSLIVDAALPAALKATAWSEDGAIMAIEAYGRSLFGVQFHPESCLTEYGDRILQNFQQITNERRGLTSSCKSFVVTTDTLPSSTPQAVAQELILRAKEIPIVCDASRIVEERSALGDVAWLDSVIPGAGTGRFSYVAFGGGPLYERLTYGVHDKMVKVERPHQPASFLNCSIFDYLEERLASYRITKPTENFPDFCGGYVGWLGYECKIDCGSRFAHKSDTPDASLFFSDRVLAIDHFDGKTYVIGLCEPDTVIETNEWLEQIVEQLTATPPEFGVASTPGDGAVSPIELRPTRDQAEYLCDIERCFEFLRAGETYEICLTNRFESQAVLEPFDTYLSLRDSNPAPYAAFISINETHVLCSSPERFLRISDEGEMEAKPIKGTASRHDDPLLDAEIAAKLADDPKERAENLMIVDLLRSDLGRVAEIGTVHVASLMSIETFSSVHQMVSTVRAKKRKGVSAVQCVRVCFPGGSMTGAPKIRTMEIIDQLEGRARGIYSGAVGYFSVSGAVDLNIVIRTLVYSGNKVSVGAGGAITVLSEPSTEWQEVLLKANSAMTVLNRSKVAS